MALTFPDNLTQYPTTGSFLINVVYTGSANSGTFTYTLKLIDALQNVVTKSFTLSVANNYSLSLS